MPKLISQLEISSCPHCGVNTPNVHQAHHMETRARSDSRHRYWKVYSCQRCGGVITAASDTQAGEIIEMYPSVTVIDESIPQTARSYLLQALNSLHAPAGAVMLSASAVDAMLKEKNYKTGSLYKRIDEAAKDHLITDDMARWAHEVRLDANDQRHADEAAVMPSESDARKCVDFSLALAQFLFVLPQRIQRGLSKASS